MTIAKQFIFYFKSNFKNERRDVNLSTEQQCLLENLLLFDESKDLNKCKLVNVDQAFFQWI